MATGSPPSPGERSAVIFDAIDALQRAWSAGFKDADWARRDPDLSLLHDDPELDRMYPPNACAT